MLSRRKVAALVAEFLGTGILAFIVLAVSRSQIGIPYFVSIAAGLVIVLVGVTTQRDVQLNPALTLGLWTGRRIKTVKAILVIVAQLLGGLAAYALFKYFSRGNVQQLPTAYDGRVLVAEAFGMFVLAFAAAGALYQRLHPMIRPVITGAGYTIGVMAASSAAAGLINPAVALASNAWAWSTYVLGPVLGALIGVNLYGLLFAPRERGERVVAKAKTDKAVASKVADDEADANDEDDDTDSKKSVVEEHVAEDKAAVPAHRLDKIAKAEKEAKADKKKASKKKSKK